MVIQWSSPLPTVEMHVAHTDHACVLQVVCVDLACVVQAACADLMAMAAWVDREECVVPAVVADFVAG